MLHRNQRVSLAFCLRLPIASAGKNAALAKKPSISPPPSFSDNDVAQNSCLYAATVTYPSLASGPGYLMQDGSRFLCFSSDVCYRCFIFMSITYSSDYPWQEPRAVYKFAVSDLVMQGISSRITVSFRIFVCASSSSMSS